MAIYLALIDIGIHNGLKDTIENPQRSVFRLTLESFYSFGCKSHFFSKL
jgi:hypothetical protein